MAVSITYKNVINLASNGVSFKKEDKDNKYYINCYINGGIKFKLKYTDNSTRNIEFEQLIDDIYNGSINIDLNYTGEIIEVIK